MKVKKERGQSRGLSMAPSQPENDIMELDDDDDEEEDEDEDME